MIPSAIVCLLIVSPSGPTTPAPFPTLTTTKDGRAGDPINLRLVGTKNELVAAFCAAGWSPADRTNVRSAVRIGASVVLNRPYPQAPVSDLYLFGRVQDVAVEREVGGSARSRHHARFWEAGCTADGRSIWVGAGTFDARVGRSPATGKITHRIAPDVDTERDTVLADLGRAGRLSAARLAPRDGPFDGKNGEGDCYYTDGNVGEGELTGCVDGAPAIVTRRISRGR
ncbi:LssY C-terminal domain-containing protein [Fimbriiglobus ruber]|uniref:LssY C-terminal domain-containing protein n=1 Tax=Fimbriiglobus ruber TaxID=1908690 RepID=UPI000B4B3082|nr:LssY C-terminal domain-containing protein [Fimbriiglobus ruber]